MTTRKPRAKYHVFLSPDERAQLQVLIAKGSSSARRQTHARILLKVDEAAEGPAWSDLQVQQALEVGDSTIYRVRQRYVEQGLPDALGPRRPRRAYNPKLDGHVEAVLIAKACSDPPEGHSHWSLRLLANWLVEMEFVQSVSYETVRQTLKKTNCGPGRRSAGAFR